MKTLKLTVLFICGAFMMSFTSHVAPVISTPFSLKDISSVQWKTTSADLGEIPQGKPVTIDFEFTNTGKEDVIIANAQASCGCTVANYPKEPIAPGKSAKVTATYNAAAMGVFTKNVTVTIKGEEPKVLSFKGTVI